MSNPRKNTAPSNKGKGYAFLLDRNDSKSPGTIHHPTHSNPHKTSILSTTPVDAIF